MLTDTQKAKVRLYLGRPDQFRDADTLLESMLNILSPEAYAQVIELLAKLETIETALIEAGTAGAGVKRVDEIWFDNGWMRSSQVRKTGRMYAARISIITGVPIVCDVFGTDGYLGSGAAPRGYFNLA